MGVLHIFSNSQLPTNLYLSVIVWLPSEVEEGVPIPNVHRADAAVWEVQFLDLVKVGVTQPLGHKV